MKSLIAPASILSAATAGLTIGLATPAQATFVGGQSWLSVRDCSTIAVADGCRTGTAVTLPRPIVRQITGGVGQQTNDTASSPGLGSSFGNVSFVGPNALPQIRAAVDTTGNSRNGSTNTAVQTFTWTGLTAVDVPLVATIDYTTTATNAWSSDPLNGDSAISDSAYVFAGITLFDPTIIDPDSLLIETLGALGLGCTTPGVIAAVNSIDRGPTALTVRTLDITTTCSGAPLSLAPGMSFGIAMYLQAIGNRGADIDASHTFSINFDPNLSAIQLAQLQQGLIGNPVPEPGAFALLGLGLAAIGFARRAKRN
jgi:PEP-CTERM motif